MPDDPMEVLLEHLRDGAGMLGEHEVQIEHHNTRLRVFEKLILEGNSRPPLISQVETQHVRITALEGHMAKVHDDAREAMTTASVAAREAAAAKTAKDTETGKDRAAVRVALIAGIVALLTALISKY